MPPTPPEAAPAPGCRFAHLTDLHLTNLAAAPRSALRGKRLLGYLSWRRRRRAEHRREVLDTLLRHLRADAREQVLISGDLTHIGLPQEFREAAQWLAALGPGPQVGVVPGNHELCARGGVDAGLALWRDYLAGDGPAAAPFPSLRERAGVAFIGVSTAVVTPALLATGRVGSRQRSALAARLRDAARRGLFRVVYLHHCPLPGTDRWRKRLTDAAAVSAVLREEGVELVLHGHGHRSLRGQLQTRHGAAPVLGTASASAAGNHGEAAGYRDFRVTRTAGGWRLRQRRFRYDPASAAVLPAGEEQEEALPRAHAGATHAAGRARREGRCRLQDPAAADPPGT